MFKIETDSPTGWVEADTAHNAETAKVVAERIANKPSCVVGVRYREVGSPYVFTVQETHPDLRSRW